MLLRIVSYVVIGIATFFTGYFVRRYISEGKISNAEEAAKKIIADAEKEAESKKRESILEAKEEVHKLRSELDRETRERRSELQRLERRLLIREETLDKKVDAAERKENDLNKKQEDVQVLKNELSE
ncbi:MAG TPA: ribonuclease Y, partial [Clostridiaceae bacterium]|nr:ribonuclease Y [Clostridiaceae bacterium]